MSRSCPNARSESEKISRSSLNYHPQLAAEDVAVFTRPGLHRLTVFSVKLSSISFSQKSTLRVFLTSPLFAYSNSKQT